MKKLLSIIGTLNLSIVPAVSTISCSLFGGNNDDDKEDENNENQEDTEDLNLSQTEEEVIENAVKSVDDTVILTKLEGGINANNILTTNSTFNDAIEFLKEQVQEIDSSASVESNEDDKLNNNLVAGDNTISVKLKKNSEDEGQTINALITDIHNQEPRISGVFENLIKSIFEDGVHGGHLSVANDYQDILPIINGKLDDVDDEIKISLVDKHPNEKLNGGNNKVKIRFTDKDNNECIFPVDVKDVQGTGFVGKLRAEYPDSVVFKIADHMADAFGIQKLDKLYNLSGLGLLQQTSATIKSTGHYIIDKIKYRQEYGNNPEEDINGSKKGFLSKIKDKLKFKKSKSSAFYSANNEENNNTFVIPVTDENDHTSETLKVKIQAKSAEETDKEAQHLIKSMFSSPINGKTLNTNEKISAIIPLVKAKMNTISGLHQWNIAFKDKKNEKKALSETNKVELNFSKSNSKSNFALSVTVNEVKKVNSDLNLNLLPQRIDTALWGITTASTWDHLLENIILSLKLNTAKYKIEIVSKKLKSKLTEQDNNKSFNLKIAPKKGKEKNTTIAVTLFNIKPGKEKTTKFDNLYKKTQQISKKNRKKFWYSTKSINK